MFSYAALSREDEAAAREDAALVRSNASDIARKGIEIGRALNRQKAKMGHGMFMAWVRDECGMSQSTAGRLMRVAREMANKLPIDGQFTALGTTALELLIAENTTQEVRDQVEALLVDGQKVTVADIRRMKAEARAASETEAEAKAKVSELEASQSEEAAKIAKRVGDGFEANCAARTIYRLLRLRSALPL